MDISPDRIASAAYVAADLHPQLDPDAAFWRDASPIEMRYDAFRNAIPGNSTEVRIVWTDTALHLLFLCGYERLHLREGHAVVDAPTEQLWLHDVAEIFIAAGADTPTRYAEFEISPRGEWLALDIETKSPGEPHGQPIQAGAHFSAAIDAEKKAWLGMVRIPFSTLHCARPAPGTEFRMNLFRSQGIEPALLAWRPTMHPSFHVPASFGFLILEGEQK